MPQTTDQRVSTLEAHRQGDQGQLAEIKTQLATLDGKVDEINLRLAGQRGFVAGMMAIVLPLWSVVTIAAGSIWQWVTGGGHAS